MGLFQTKLVETAQGELAQYQHLFEQQSPLRERIGQYWAFVDRPDLDGGDHDVPWSAAFVSFMIHLAGAGSAFPYSAQHSVYFYRTINDKVIKKKTAFWGFKPNELTVQPGDVLGMNRSTAPAIDYDWAAHHSDYKSHSDIVSEVNGTTLRTIGGNVGQSPGQVSVKTFVWNGTTFTNQASPAQQAFVVIRSFLP